MIKKAIVYQIRVWCCEDSCGEFWFDKELSDLYEDQRDAEKELEKYLGMSESELEKERGVACVSKEGPKIVELILNKKRDELY
jgi:hypothetical protein